MCFLMPECIYKNESLVFANFSTRGLQWTTPAFAVVNKNDLEQISCALCLETVKLSGASICLGRIPFGLQNSIATGVAAPHFRSLSAQPCCSTLSSLKDVVTSRLEPDRRDATSMIACSCFARWWSHVDLCPVTKASRMNQYFSAPNSECKTSSHCERATSIPNPNLRRKREVSLFH